MRTNPPVNLFYKGLTVKDKLSCAPAPRPKLFLLRCLQRIECILCKVAECFHKLFKRNELNSFFLLRSNTVSRRILLQGAIIITLTLFLYLLTGYSSAIEILESQALELRELRGREPMPVYVAVPVASEEARIPEIYQAAELDAYCSADWRPRQSAGFWASHNAGV